MTKSAIRLLENGWRRIHNGWWHADLGEEPHTGKSMRDAIACLESKQKTQSKNT